MHSVYDNFVCIAEKLLQCDVLSRNVFNLQVIFMKEPTFVRSDVFLIILPERTVKISLGKSPDSTSVFVRFDLVRNVVSLLFEKLI